MSVAIFSPTPYINKWQMSLCNNSSDNKSYWIHRVDVKVSAQVTTVTYMHQSQPSLQLLRISVTVHLELWPGNHLIWCNATFTCSIKQRWRSFSSSFFLFRWRLPRPRSETSTKVSLHLVLFIKLSVLLFLVRASVRACMRVCVCVCVCVCACVCVCVCVFNPFSFYVCFFISILYIICKPDFLYNFCFLFYTFYGNQ